MGNWTATKIARVCCISIGLYLLVGGIVYYTLCLRRERLWAEVPESVWAEAAEYIRDPEQREEIFRRSLLDEGEILQGVETWLEDRQGGSS